MLNSHNNIRFIIIDQGFTRKTVYKHSISNYNLFLLSKYISFNQKSAKIKLHRCIKHRQNCILKTAMDTSNVSDKIADVSSPNEVSYVHNGSFKYGMNSSSNMNILIPMHIICLQKY